MRGTAPTANATSKCWSAEIDAFNNLIAKQCIGSWTRLFFPIGMLELFGHDLLVGLIAVERSHVTGELVSDTIKCLDRDAL